MIRPGKYLPTIRNWNRWGLAAPQVTYIMHDLKEKGFPVSVHVTTVQEAADEIMKALEREA